MAVKTRDKTNWLKVVFWNNLADLVSKYVNKGDQLGVTGEISVRDYEVDGTKRTAYEINVNDITFVGSKKDKDQDEPLFTDIIEIDGQDDLPF